MNQGRSVFAQLMDLLARGAFAGAVQRYGGRRAGRRLSCMDQLLAMVFAQLTGRASLRETVTCLNALGPRRYHCGLRAAPARSTLAEANEKRDYRIFRDTALAMIAAARVELPVDRDLLRLEHRAYALDSTTIDLCLTHFPWAHFRRRKAAIKAHTVLDLQRGVPVFVRVSSGKTHGLWMLDQLVIEPAAVYVMDKGYTDFQRLHRIHTTPAFFITRAKRGADFVTVRRLEVTPNSGVTSDRIIRMRGPRTRGLYPDPLRLVRYTDPLTHKRLSFLTNNFALAAADVALLYRKRWRIELFFKWVKQHLHIRAFFGTTPNAVQTQVWIAVLVYVLVASLKHRYQLPQEMNDLLQVLSVTILEKVPVFELFSASRAQDTECDNRKQLQLFEM